MPYQGPWAANAPLLANFVNAMTGQAGTFAARPAAGRTGAIYFATDTLALYRDSGATWNLLGYMLGDVRYIVTSGFTKTNSTLEDSVLTFEVGASEHWLVEVWIPYTAVAGIDLVFDFTLPSGAVSSNSAKIYHTVANNYDEDLDPGPLGGTGDGDGHDRILRGSFDLETGSGGDVTFQTARNGTSGTNEYTVRAGAFLKARRLS